MAVHGPQDEDNNHGDRMPEGREESIPPMKTTPLQVKGEEESHSEVEEARKNEKKKKKKEGQQQKQANDDSGKGKPKAGVGLFLGRVRTASKE